MNTSIRIRSRSLVFVAALPFAGTLMVGCGSDPAKNTGVSGKVTVDGKPAKGAALTLHL